MLGMHLEQHLVSLQLCLVASPRAKLLVFTYRIPLVVRYTN